MEREDGSSVWSLILSRWRAPGAAGGVAGLVPALPACSKGRFQTLTGPARPPASHFTETLSFLTVPLTQKQLAKAVNISPNDDHLVICRAPVLCHGLCRALSCFISPRPQNSQRPSEGRKETLRGEVACPGSPSLGVVEPRLESAISFLEICFFPPGSQ